MSLCQFRKIGETISLKPTRISHSHLQVFQLHRRDGDQLQLLIELLMLDNLDLQALRLVQSERDPMTIVIARTEK